MVGGVETFPIFCLEKKHAHQPKYKHAVVQLYWCVHHLGLHGYLSGPPHRTVSDTTTAPNWELHIPGRPHVHLCTVYLPPYGEEMCQASESFAEFMRVHQWYRAQIEHAFVCLNKFAIVAIAGTI